MIAYASRTGTKRNLDALRRAGWRLLVSAKGDHRPEGFRYAIDNGAWTAHTRGQPFDEAAFALVVEKLGHGADWIVAPDIVGGGLDSLRMSLSWLDRLLPIAPVLLAVQDGMVPHDVRGVLSSRLGIFVGGSTDWKLRTVEQWGKLGACVGCHVHVGRVNTVRRVFQCRDAGATSFDGSSVSRWAINLPRLEGARRQEGFKWR